jgi:hypothetical protein
MPRERQKHTLRQALPDWVSLGATEFDGCANEVGATLGIDDKAVGRPARAKQERRFAKLKVGLSGPQNREGACLQQVQMAPVAKLRRLAKLSGEEGPGGRRDVSEQASKGIHGTISKIVGTKYHS